MKGGLNIGHFEPNEHIGHMSREFSSKFAPIFDQYSNSKDAVNFNFHLYYSDTNHSRHGYQIDILVLSDCSSEFNEQLYQQFIAADLQPSMI